MNTNLVVLLSINKHFAISFSQWKRKLDIYLHTLEANNEEKVNIFINRLQIKAVQVKIRIYDTARVPNPGIPYHFRLFKNPGIFKQIPGFPGIVFF